MTHSERKWLLEQMASQRKRPAGSARPADAGPRRQLDPPSRPPATNVPTTGEAASDVRAGEPPPAPAHAMEAAARRATPGVGKAPPSEEERAGAVPPPTGASPTPRPDSEEETTGRSRPVPQAESFWSFG